LKVLVTDGDYKHTLGIVRSLGKKGIVTTVLAQSAKTFASRSRYCAGIEIAPSPSDGRFAEAVAEIVHRTHYDLTIAVGYVSTAALARHRADLHPYTKLELPEFDKIQSAADKRRVYELAAEVGVPAPRTVYPSHLDELPARSSEFVYPVVIKPRRESPGGTVRYAQEPEALMRVYRTFCEGQGYTGGELPMIQEFISGYGCGLFALYQNGVCKRIFMHRRIRENPPSGGASSCAESFYDPRLKDYGTRLLNALGWHGVAMVEFRYDTRAGDYKVVEINPKFWGSLDLALAAGVDFPFYLCQMAEGQQLAYSDDYNRNLRYQWPLAEDFYHLCRRPSSWAAVLFDLLNPRVKSNLWLRDFQPNLDEAHSLAYWLVKQSRENSRWL
jgi:predicted ATP-grasp superfamily ATP-dependent carboligase